MEISPLVEEEKKVRQKRAQVCMDEIQATLEKYNFKLIPMCVIRVGNIVSTIELEDKQ